MSGHFCLRKQGFSSLVRAGPGTDHGDGRKQQPSDFIAPRPVEKQAIPLFKLYFPAMEAIKWMDVHYFSICPDVKKVHQHSFSSDYQTSRSCSTNYFFSLFVWTSFCLHFHHHSQDFTVRCD